MPIHEAVPAIVRFYLDADEEEYAIIEIPDGGGFLVERTRDEVMSPREFDAVADAVRAIEADQSSIDGLCIADHD